MAPAQLPAFRSYLLRRLRDDPSLGYRQLLSLLQNHWDVTVGKLSFHTYISDLKAQIASGADVDYDIITSEDQFRIHYMHLRAILADSYDMPSGDILQKLRDDYQIDLAMPLLTQVYPPLSANCNVLIILFDMTLPCGVLFDLGGSKIFNACFFHCCLMLAIIHHTGLEIQLDNAN